MHEINTSSWTFMLSTRSLSLNLQVLHSLGVAAGGFLQRDLDTLLESQGIAIVRKVLQDNKSQNARGWKTHELYTLALKEPAPEGFRSAVKTGAGRPAPPHVGHPIRSKRCVPAFDVVLPSGY